MRASQPTSGSPQPHARPARSCAEHRECACRRRPAHSAARTACRCRRGSRRGIARRASASANSARQCVAQRHRARHSDARRDALAGVLERGAAAGVGRHREFVARVGAEQRRTSIAQCIAPALRADLRAARARGRQCEVQPAAAVGAVRELVERRRLEAVAERGIQLQRVVRPRARAEHRRRRRIRRRSPLSSGLRAVM